jgi:hypothetical protein
MKKLAALAALSLVVLLAGCGKAQEPFKDAPGSSVVNQVPADKVLMPDGFSNLTTSVITATASTLPSTVTAGTPPSPLFRKIPPASKEHSPCA